MLKNPSSSVVSVEIQILSQYPAPLEALDLLTKWYAWRVDVLYRSQ